VQVVQETPRWERRGRSYGLAASLNAAHGRVVVISPPTAVKEEGDDAVDQWRTGFDKAFTVQVQTQRESTGADERLAGKLGKATRKRKLSLDDEVKEGVPGLQSAASLTVLSNAVYDIVRSDFYLPEDDGEVVVKDALAQTGFDFNQGDWDTWWGRAGHTLVKKKAKSARYAVGVAVKSALFKVHGTSITPGWSDHSRSGGPARRTVGHESPSLTPNKKDYDTSTRDGQDAKALLDKWAQETSDNLPAPWRMTAGSGGSDFGKPLWFLTLCRAFKKDASAPGQFKIWQLALADLTVRGGCYTGQAQLTSSTNAQAKKLIKPTNPKAVGTSGAASKRSSLNAEDSERLVRSIETALKLHLKDINPAKLTVEGLNGGAPVVIDIQITGFTATPSVGAA